MKASEAKETVELVTGEANVVATLIKVRVGPHSLVGELQCCGGDHDSHHVQLRSSSTRNVAGLEFNQK